MLVRVFCLREGSVGCCWATSEFEACRSMAVRGEGTECVEAVWDCDVCFRNPGRWVRESLVPRKKDCCSCLTVVGVTFSFCCMMLV